MIVLDYRDKRPLNEQVAEKIMNLIAQGGLVPGERLPSVRNLAMDLSVNPNTVQRAYAALEEKGYITTITGRGNYVSEESQWKNNLKKEVLDELESAAGKAMSCSVGLEEALECVRKAYERDVR
ncbi:MAG: GntR family transcriptional regulator [Lachnospiraceae bacterium]|nr:GntR family transcriptional regulator [Lachnospiraceae bacterium]MCR5440758.1 GntR family transcriptional regulator [Lachnospiraceae bacterium]